MRVRFWMPRPSRGADALRRRLGVLRLRREGSGFRAKPRDLLINWGGASPPPRMRLSPARTLNHATVVERASNKSYTYNLLSQRDVPTPAWTTDRAVAAGWDRVVVRHVLRGHGGLGIQVVTPAEEPLPDAPLYTCYWKHVFEYRVHVIRDPGDEWHAEIHVQQKRLRRDVPEDDRDFAVRTHDRGWVYCTEDVQAPQPVVYAAKCAVVALGLDFGAVDVGWNRHYQHAKVFEVNTAPGLEGRTLDFYEHAFRDLIEYFTYMEAN